MCIAVCWPTNGSKQIYLDRLWEFTYRMPVQALPLTHGFYGCPLLRYIRLSALTYDPFINAPTALAIHTTASKRSRRELNSLLHLDRVPWSGSRKPLLAPSPLRTVRATFTAHGSSNRVCLLLPMYRHVAVQMDDTQVIGSVAAPVTSLNHMMLM